MPSEVENMDSVEIKKILDLNLILSDLYYEISEAVKNDDSEKIEDVVELLKGLEHGTDALKLSIQTLFNNMVDLDPDEIDVQETENGFKV